MLKAEKCRNESKPTAEVKISRDTSVLTWVADDRNSRTPIYTCDIFINQNRHWHAIYSQHSTAAG
jgi:hypothetical protein